MKNIKSIVLSEYHGIKIVDYLKKALLLSASLVKKVKFGGVFINGKNVTMRATVNEGDEVLVILPTEKSDGIRPINMPLDIIYEDEYFIAVNKPCGMPTHPSKGNSLPTLAEGIMAYFDNEDFVFRAINRLDRDTSGIVIIAKDAHTANKLSASMKAGNYIKKYVGIFSGVPSPAFGIIDAPIEREREGEIRRIVRSDGKRAITEYNVLKILSGGDSICEITLHTGRTHQIRVHMAYIGHPLVGDFLYGERIEGKTYSLHAKYMEFPHPITEKTVTLNSKASFE